MAIARSNPPELHVTAGYHHVTVVTDVRLILLAGQCPLRSDGSVAGDDPLTQTDQIVANALVALASVGATPDDVVRTTIYVASSEQSVLVDVWDRLNSSPLAAAFTTASTLVGVTVLGYPGQLVELDVTAALPHP